MRAVKIGTLLQNNSWGIERSGDLSNPSVKELQNNLNTKLKNDGSKSRISDLKVEYFTNFEDKSTHGVFEYELILSGNLINYNIIHQQDFPRGLADMGWRGITFNGPVIIDGIDINNPLSIISTKLPEFSQRIQGSDAVLLKTNIINSEDLKETLDQWQWRFDPFGNIAPYYKFGISEKPTEYTLSEFQIQKFTDKISAGFEFDKKYEINLMEEPSKAIIYVMGFAAIDNLEGIEVIGYTRLPPEGFGKIPTEQIKTFDQESEDFVMLESVYDLNEKGNNLLDLGMYEEAITWYDKALEVDPRHVNALNNKKDALFRLEEKREEERNNGGGCLIATATFGSELAPQVQQLRELRDNKLLQTESGQSFMSSFNDFYYLFSPTIADYERENPV